ncbi:MAG: alkaline phosphatase family protein [Myxococcota bacterium]
MISLQQRSWAQETIARIGRRVGRLPTRRPRKFLLVHLDGVPRAVLEQAIAQGTMPFFSSLVRSGAYHFDTAFWGSPASTPCFQAGLLYGLRHPNLPAYHWFDRGLGRVVRMNVPLDAHSVESRLGARPENSLLEGGGTTYLSLFHAGAKNQLDMTSLRNLPAMARALFRDLKGIRGGSRRGVLAYLGELMRDMWGAGKDVVRWTRRLHGDWRHEREYLLNRFLLIRLAWSLAHSRALIDMVLGVPAIYLVFGNFDEVAHRRGPCSAQALGELYRVDAHLAELYALAHTLEEPYDVYFFTDHGHVDSAPLEQRVGKKLERCLSEGPAAPLPKEVERGLLDGRALLAGGPVWPREEPVVIEAGNFAHVYLTRGHEPLEAMALLQRHREVLSRAVALSDIGLVAVRRGSRAVAIVRGGVYGANELHGVPLPTDFSKRAVADLLEELPHMKSAGDLVLFGAAHQRGGTVGFAWEFGSHGGLTRIETESVVCWPVHGPVELSALSHSTQLHQRLSTAYRGGK